MRFWVVCAVVLAGCRTSSDPVKFNILVAVYGGGVVGGNFDCTERVQGTCNRERNPATAVAMDKDNWVFDHWEPYLTGFCEPDGGSLTSATITLTARDPIYPP